MSKREAVKAEILRQVEARLEKALGDDETVAEMTLTEIEELALAVGTETGRGMTATLTATSGWQGERPDCPQCGQAMRHKGYRDKEVITRTGEVRVRRAYYYCERCRKGLFPPG